MSPAVSRWCARVKHRMNLAPGPELDSLIRAAETTEAVADLPAWIRKTGEKLGLDPKTGL